MTWLGSPYRDISPISATLDNLWMVLTVHWASTRPHFSVYYFSPDDLIQSHSFNKIALFIHKLFFQPWHLTWARFSHSIENFVSPIRGLIDVTNLKSRVMYLHPSLQCTHYSSPILHCTTIQPTKIFRSHPRFLFPSSPFPTFQPKLCSTSFFFLLVFNLLTYRITPRARHPFTPTPRPPPLLPPLVMLNIFKIN